MKVQRIMIAAIAASVGSAAAAVQPGGASATQRQAGGASARSVKPAAVPIPRAVFLANMDTEFQKIDADRNRVLTRQEIEQSQRSAGMARAHNQLRARFAGLDTDRNGQLSLAEFGRLLPPPAPPNAAPVLSRFDLNRDNSVSLVEYRTGTLANFDRLDTDKDGIVSPAEMKLGGIGK